MAAVLFSGACGGGDDNDTPGASQTAKPIAGSVTPTAATTPTQAPIATPTDILYVVLDGDTLGGIADSFGISVESILDANGLSADAVINVGDTLTIPDVVPPDDPNAAPLRTPDPTDFSQESPIGFHLSMPAEGACLTQNDDQMPNSPREYRAGIHEGVDFFTGFACTDFVRGTPVLAAADGTVIRADKDYRPITEQQVQQLTAESLAQGFTSPGTLDKFRGRQIWIDHGNGIVTRYSHLDGVDASINVGTRVTAGQLIGTTGDSGTVESISNPDFNLHLHFEVRTGDTFLGAGLPPDEVRRLYEQAFGIAGGP